MEIYSSPPSMSGFRVLSHVLHFLARVGSSPLFPPVGFTYVVGAAVAVAAVGLAVAHEAVGPDPVDVFDGAAWLLQHDVAVGGVVGRRGAVGDGEVAAGRVAGQEDGDVEDLRRALLVVGRQRHLAVGCYVQRDVEGVYEMAVLDLG